MDTNTTDSFIRFIEAYNYGKLSPGMFELSYNRCEFALSDPPYTEELYNRYIKAFKEVPAECIRVRGSLQERIFRISYSIQADAVLTPTEAPIEAPTEAPTEAPVEFNHKEFLHTIYDYSILDAVDIIKDHPDAFNTHYAEFIIYMYLGIKPKLFNIKEYPIYIPAMACGVKKKFIELRSKYNKLESPALDKHYAIYETDKFNVKELMKDALIEGGFTKNATALAKSFFTPIELEEFMPAVDNIDKYIYSIHKNM